MASLTFHTAYSKLVSLAYENDIEVQRQYLSVIEEQRKIPVSYLLERGCLFIPNNDYIHHYLGNEADQYGLDFYNGDRCQWTLYVLLPITDLAGDVVGLVGWDAYHKYQEQVEGQSGLSMYKVSSKYVFKRERYFLSDVGLLKQTFSSRTVFITDGVFDSVALNYRGIPAIALLGSTFSTQILYFLRWYKKIFVCADNDPAGNGLYRSLKKAVPNVYLVRQGNTKDIEELLRSDGVNGPITQQLKKTMCDEDGCDIFLKFTRQV